MAFPKFANARMVESSIDVARWDFVRRQALAPAPDFTQRTAKVILQEYDPKRFLISHCTIIASVDVEDVDAKLGRQMVDGFQIDRRYPDYYITPETVKYVNNNHDCWERKLLLSCFKTFIGAENYVEHIQIPEMSRGKIIDAAARNIGDSVYVDILIATDRRHDGLVKAITSGQIGTLSMGCFIKGTQVTMSDGTRLPIEEVAPGDLVVTHRGRIREVRNKQIRVGTWGMRRIEAVGLPSSITATDNHPFFVLRTPEYCACGCSERLESSARETPARRINKRFKQGHQMRVYNPNGSYSLDEARQRRTALAESASPTLVEVRADALRKGDYLCFPRVGNEVVCLDDATEGKARLLGYFLAEGSFIKTKGVPTEVQFNFSLTEKDTLAAETIRLLAQEFPEANPAWLQLRPDRTTCTVHVTGGGVPAWFKDHGGEYSHLKKLSSNVMAWPTELQKQLLGAWIDGDGCASKIHRNVSGTTTSYTLACQAHLLLARIGVFSRMECRFEGRSASIEEAVNGGVARRGDNGKLASFTLVVGNSFTGRLCDVTSKAGSSKYTQHLRVLDEHIIFPITSVESLTYEGPVYDMEVDEDHSYIVEGAAVHNCSVDFTACTKCGNVAEDETQLCPHIRYFKGREFIDPSGRTRKIAELCGHIKAEPGSVKFIEASWVANPAFTGAVLRNILTPEEIQGLSKRMQVAFAAPPRVPDADRMQKAARATWENFNHMMAAQQGQSEEEFPGGGGSAKSEESSDPLHKAVEDFAKVIKDKAIEHVRKEMDRDEASKVRDVINENENDSLIKSALTHPSWRRIARFVVANSSCAQATKKILYGLILYKAGGWSRVRSAGSFTGREILALSRIIDLTSNHPSKAGEARVYRTVLAVGGMAPYSDVQTYLAACRQVLGRSWTGSEAASLLEKGRLYALGS